MSNLNLHQRCSFTGILKSIFLWTSNRLIPLIPGMFPEINHFSDFQMVHQLISIYVLYFEHLNVSEDGHFLKYVMIPTSALEQVTPHKQRLFHHSARPRKAKVRHWQVAAHQTDWENWFAPNTMKYSTPLQDGAQKFLTSMTMNTRLHNLRSE